MVPRGIGANPKASAGIRSGILKETLVSNAFQASRDVIIRTQNLAATTQFYEGVFGLKVVVRRDTLVGLDAGAFRLYLEEGPPHGPVFDFLVPDLQAAKSALESAGCVVIEENPAVPRCYIRDPHGLVFNIEQRSGPAA